MFILHEYSFSSSIAHIDPPQNKWVLFLSIVRGALTLYDAVINTDNPSALLGQHFKTTPTALGFVIWLPSCGEPIPICLAYSFRVEEGNHFYRAHPTSGTPVINGFSLACHTQTTHPSLNIVITENAKVVVKDDPFPPTSPGSKHAMER